MPEAEDVLSGMTLATKMLFLTAYTNLGPSVYATTAEELHFVDYLILQKLQDPDFLTGFKFCVKRGNPWCPWVENPYCFPKKPEEDVVMTDAPKCKTPVKVYFDGVPQKQVPPPQQAPVQKDPSQEAVEQHQKQTGNQSNGQQNNQVSEQQKTSEHVKYAQQALSMANRMPPSEERQWMMNIATYILNEGQNDKKKEPEITYVPPYLTSIDSDGKPKFERLLTPEETRNVNNHSQGNSHDHSSGNPHGHCQACASQNNGGHQPKPYLGKRHDGRPSYNPPNQGGSWSGGPLPPPGGHGHWQPNGPNQGYHNGPHNGQGNGRGGRRGGRGGGRRPQYNNGPPPAYNGGYYDGPS